MARLARGALGAAAMLIWGGYIGRLLLRSLHMLQLEDYQTVRFLRWSMAKPERWARPDRTLLAVGALVVAVATARPLAKSGRRAVGAVRELPLRPASPRTRAGRGLPLLASWAALGAWLWRGARFGKAKKPLVLTARAKRLLAGEAVIAAAGALGPAALAVRGGRPDRAIPAVCAGASLTSLAAPLIAATANLMLWPVEEAFRRYYLRDARRRLRRYGPTVVAVAGSYGKTSTKEFLATILGRRWKVLRPPGSHNTPMGLSRVIREQLEPRHELFVAELGDYGPGEIRALCDLLRPRIGVLTTIGPEHLERFKTMERIVRAKEELFEALPADGVAVVNQDDPLVRMLGERAEQRGLRVVRHGHAEGEGRRTVQARGIRMTRDGLVFTVVAEGHGEANFEIGVLGRHNVANLLAATAVGLELGMSLAEIAEGARQITPVEHRLQPIRGAGGVLVVDDTFNSNPRGAAEALEVLAALDGGRRVLVTPGMVELGEREFDENRAFGRKAAAVCDEVILVGRERARPLQAGLRDAGYAESQTHVVGTLAEATARLQGMLRSGDIVLFENDLPDLYDDSERNGAAVAHAVAVDDPAGAVREPPPVDDPAPTAAKKPSFIHVGGLRLAYRETGTATAAPPIVVLHGWGASGAAVASIQRCFDGDRRTIAPDLPGFGESDPPPVAWGNADYAEVIRSLLAQLGIERADFIGHSRGGAIGIVLAATRPALVERLVIVDSAGIRAQRSARYWSRVYAFKAARWAGQLLPPLREWAVRRFGSEDYRRAGSLRQTLVRVVNEDLRPLLPRVQAPTLLIWGEEDDATPVADGHVMERMIPDTGLVVFPGAGHFSYADDPGRFCRVVRHFLAR